MVVCPRTSCRIAARARRGCCPTPPPDRRPVLDHRGHVAARCDALRLGAVGAPAIHHNPAMRDRTGGRRSSAGADWTGAALPGPPRRQPQPTARRSVPPQPVVAPSAWPPRASANRPTASWRWAGADGVLGRGGGRGIPPTARGVWPSGVGRPVRGQPGQGPMVRHLPAAPQPGLRRRGPPDRGLSDVRYSSPQRGRGGTSNYFPPPFSWILENEKALVPLEQLSCSHVNR